MRKTITISVDERLYQTILERTRATYCSSVSEYLRRLVRRDLEKTAAQDTETSVSRIPRRARDIVAGYDRDV